MIHVFEVFVKSIVKYLKLFWSMIDMCLFILAPAFYLQSISLLIFLTANKFTSFCLLEDQKMDNVNKKWRKCRNRNFINIKKEMKYFLGINFVISFGNQLITFYGGLLVSWWIDWKYYHTTLWQGQDFRQ